MTRPESGLDDGNASFESDNENVDRDSDDENELGHNGKKIGHRKEKNKPAIAALPDVSDSEVEDDEESTKEASKNKEKMAEESSDDEVLDRRKDDKDEDRQRLSDFDSMMERKRAEKKRRGKRKDIDVINDNDDAIAKLIADMRIAAKDDRELNIMGKPATRKIGMFKVA